MAAMHSVQSSSAQLADSSMAYGTFSQNRCLIQKPKGRFPA